MARISVEQKAFTDPRFRLLGSALNATNLPKEVIERACGLYMAIEVWNECTERGVYKLKPEIVEAIREGLVSALISADLAEMRGKLLRIKGTEGRTDWKEKQAEIGRTFGPLGAEHGRKGGRPRKAKTPQGVSENGVGGIGENPPLTLTPPNAITPAISEEKEKDTRASEPKPIEVHETAFVEMLFPLSFEALSERHPNKSPPSRAVPFWKMRATSEAAVEEIEEGHRAWMATDQWQDGIGIPTLANFLREEWYKRKPEPRKERQHANNRPNRTAARYDPSRDND